MLRTFKDLVAWQKAMGLCRAVYQVTRMFPRDERFGIIAQLRRCAVSVPSNVAEGYGRGSTRDYIRFLWNANGSICELETQLLIARELGFAAQKQVDEVLAMLAEVERILSALIESLEKKVAEA